MKFLLLLLSLSAFAGTYVELPPSAGGGSGVWGSITGTLSNQSDLQSALDAKIPKNYVELDEPNGLVGGQGVLYKTFNIEPLLSSPQETWNLENYFVNIDSNNSGLDIGTSGQAVQLFNLNMSHQGKSDIGATSMTSTYINIGNGTDPVNYKGHSIVYGLGNINNNVTIDGPIQGYGFQLNTTSGSAIASNMYVNAFYDFANFGSGVNSYTSFSASPTISDVSNNTGVAGLNINPTINNFTGNSGYTGVAVAGNYSNFGTGTWIGMNISPTVTSGAGIYGLYVSLDNATGTSKQAAVFDGDVQITGNLSFGGSLSIGSLTAYGTYNPMVSGAGNPASVHQLVTQITNASGAAITLADTIGVNTAALITLEDNSSFTSGPLGLGISALGLPAVVTTKVNSSADYINGALFAISFDAGSTGGSVTNGAGGVFTAVPNGITSVTNWRGVWSKLPFGLVATNNWSGYFEDAPLFSEEEIQANNGVRLMTSGSQPTCDSAHRGTLWNIEGGAGVADQLQVCQKNAADNYVWVTL